MKLGTYLAFPGTAEAAMTFYAETLGGTVTSVMRFEELPPGTVPEGATGVANIEIEVEGRVLRASDTMNPAEVQPPAAFHLHLDVDKVDEGARLHAALAEGGEVIMPFGPEFWTKGFGIAKDRFGISWMINVA